MATTVFSKPLSDQIPKLTFLGSIYGTSDSLTYNADDYTFLIIDGRASGTIHTTAVASCKGIETAGITGIDMHNHDDSRYITLGFSVSNGTVTISCSARKSLNANVYGYG